MSGYTNGNGCGPIEQERRLDHLGVARHLLVAHGDYDDAIAHGRNDELALFAVAHALVGIGDLIAEAVRDAAFDRRDHG